MLSTNNKILTVTFRNERGLPLIKIPAKNLTLDDIHKLKLTKESKDLFIENVTPIIPELVLYELTIFVRERTYKEYNKNGLTATNIHVGEKVFNTLTELKLVEYYKIIESEKKYVSDNDMVKRLRLIRDVNHHKIETAWLLNGCPARWMNLNQNQIVNIK